jgi:Flp pilus assembly protein TadG
MFKRLSCAMKMTKRFGRAREGHAGVMFSILALPLIFAIGFALDYAQASRYKTELQNVADAVALAAVRTLPISEQQGRIDGMSLYDALMSRIRAGLITDDITITFETTPDYKAIVEIEATAKGTFGPGIDLGTLRFEVKAEAVLGRQGTEVSLVLDLSASMETDRMKALGNSLTTFDRVINASTAAKDKLRIAAIPFAQSVTLPTWASGWLPTKTDIDFAMAQGRTCFALQGRTLDTSLTAPDSRSFALEPQYATRCMTEQAFALTQDFTQLRALATAFKNPPAWRRDFNLGRNTPYWGTNLYTGAVWASRFLNANWARHLPTGSAPDSPNKANKFAILMTDGEQLEIVGVSRATADANLFQICNDMRTNGIQVFTIGFAVTAAAEATLKRCADRDANFVKANNAAELEAAFERITKVIGDSAARLVY